jgi:hypothetical protein
LDPEVPEHRAKPSAIASINRSSRHLQTMV